MTGPCERVRQQAMSGPIVSIMFSGGSYGDYHEILDGGEVIETEYITRLLTASEKPFSNKSKRHVLG